MTPQEALIPSHQVKNIAATATAIAPVDSHPIAQSRRGSPLLLFSDGRDLPRPHVRIV